MPILSPRSKDKLSTCCQELQDVVNLAIQSYDFSVVCGHRTKEDQDAAFAAKVSKAKWPESKHNYLPSKAVDLYPWSAQYGSLTEDQLVLSRIVARSGCSQQRARAYVVEEYCQLAGVMKACATQLGIKLRWGGDWDSDGDRLDQKFDDLAHFEVLA